MADSNDSQQKKKETSGQPLKKIRQTPPAPADKKPINFIALLSLFLAIVAIATIIYVLQANRQLQQDFDRQKNAMDSHLSALKTQQSMIKDNLESTDKHLEQTAKEIRERMEGLNQQFKLTMEQRLYENQDWMLLKARYYLELAQINAHWSDSKQTTIALLKQADTILSHLKNQAIFNIRQAVAREIAQLREKPEIDIAGLLSQLDAARQTTRKLPLAVTEAKFTASAHQPNKADEANSRAWRQRLQDSVSLLEKLVVVRRHDEDIKPLLSPLYAAVIRETIQLSLQEAQWAILNHNPQVYQITLDQAIDNIKRNFDVSASITTHLLQQLNQLKSIQLERKKPDIIQSLPLLNELIRHKQDGKGEPS